MELLNGKFRGLTEHERQTLDAQGCHSDDWALVAVRDGFDVAMVRNCVFRGRVYLGRNVVISNVGVHIRDCAIGDDVRIEDVSAIECTGESAFGVGTMVAAVNENGGRAIPLHLSMTAQTAYIMAMYRHRPKLLERTMDMARREQQAGLSGICSIGSGAQIVGCGTLRNVNVGSYARLEGVRLLENGTIVSSAHAPTVVGDGVRARDFIFMENSHVDGAASLSRCFVGQGSVIEDGFTAVDSLFFANCICAEGEACSVFAGPYTVSHHKSSLLIAGLFSFFNAGSGANQSNHLFKTGPVHQGINERGCKYSSNAYVMLPARNGAFTTVLGRHSNHHDSSDFPFSYIMEDGGCSVLVPGIALRSWGTVRDLSKWPSRDNRKGLTSDIINFERFNPCLASAISRAIAVSDKLLARTTVETYTYNRLKISHAMLQRGRDTYRLALEASLGVMLSVERSDLPHAAKGSGQWVDIAGMYAPKAVIEDLLDAIEKGEYDDFHAVCAKLGQIHDSYASYAHAWALSEIEKEGITVAQAVERGDKARATLQKYCEDDARKDASLIMATGYGIDSDDQQTISADFEAVRGVKIN